MPVWGVPMIDRVVEMLRACGVDDIVVNAHCLHGQILAWADAYRAAAQAAGDSVRVRVSVEPEILGSGGALNPVRDWIGDEPFCLVNSDIVMENVPDLARPFEAAGPDEIGVALVAGTGARTLEVEPVSGLVTNWRSDDAGLDGTFTYCGFAILKPEILSYVEPTGFSSIVTAYERAMAQGRFVRAVTADDLLFEDAGTVSSYIDLNRDGEDNAFAAFPQLQALGAHDFTFRGARGSARVFFGCDRGVAILYDEGSRQENGLYAEQARWLKAKGVPVPDVLADVPSMKALLLSNAGVERAMSADDYAQAIAALVRFNALGTAADLPRLLPPFDAETWAWERDLFCRHCLDARFGREMSAGVRRELEGVAAVLEGEPKALVHRDFQSTNILWKGATLSFIDFQGMRLGPAVYDLASLVYDPYVSLTDEMRRALVALYAKLSGREAIAKVLPFAAVQRLAQCLGAYGRLASVGQPQFGRHVLPALVNLLDAADKAGLEAVGALAEDLIALERRHHGAPCACTHRHDSR